MRDIGPAGAGGSRGLLRAAVLCLGIVSIAACAGAGRASEDKQGGGPRGAAAAVARGGFDHDLLLTGELEAVRSIEIKAPQTAIFQMRIQFMAEEGSEVKPGDPLLSFDNSSLAAQVHDLETSILDAETQIVAKKNELASALKDLEIELAQKQYDHDRTGLEASVDPEVLSRKDHSERQLAYETAQRALEETRERIELTRSRGQAELDVLIINRDKLRKDLESARNGLDLLAIEAPAEGLVVYEKRDGTTLRYQEGDSCWPGQAILRLPDLSEMRVALDVNEVDMPLLEVGMPLRISLDAFPGRMLTGRIAQIPSMAVKRNEDSKIAVFKVLAVLSETWVGEMKPGMSVLARAGVQSLIDAPLVARNAVRFDGGTFRLADGTTITPLARNATHYLVSEEEYARLASRERSSS